MLFTSCPIADCRAVADAIMLPHLADVEIVRSNFNDVCAESLAARLASNPPLRDLQLAGNSLTITGVGAIMLALESNTNLRKLGLNGNALTDADVAPIIDYLQGLAPGGRHSGTRAPLHAIALKGNALSLAAQQQLMQAAAGVVPAVRLDLRHQTPVAGGPPSSNGMPSVLDRPQRRHRQAQEAPHVQPEISVVSPAQARKEAAQYQARRQPGGGFVPEGWALRAPRDSSKGVTAAVEGVERGALPSGNPLQTWDESATAEWVASLNGGFARYRRALIDAAVDLALLADLDDAGLQEVGVGVTTHRQRIMRETQALVQAVRQQLATGHASRLEL